jgi:hypothetical protein
VNPAMNRSRWRSFAPGAASLAVLLLAGCSTATPTGEGEGRAPYWKKGAGAVEAAAFMRVDIPAGASEVKGAVRVNPADSVHLLSFVTDPGAAEAFVAGLRPQSALKRMNSPSTLSGDGFAHLGLTPPHKVPGVREASVCPRCIGDERRSEVQGIVVHLAEGAADRTRVYVTAY